MSKISTYIGFAVRKGSVVWGLDNIEKYRKKIFLFLYMGSLGRTSLSRLQTIAEERKLPLLCVDDLDDILKRNVKVLAICDKNLAQAIIDNHSSESLGGKND